MLGILRAQSDLVFLDLSLEGRHCRAGVIRSSPALGRVPVETVGTS